MSTKWARADWYGPDQGSRTEQRRRQYVTDDRRPAPKATRGRCCVVCSQPLHSLSRDETCSTKVARCRYVAMFVPTTEFPTLPSSPVPCIYRPQAASEGAQGHEPPMAVYPLSLASIAAAAAEGSVAA